MLLTSFFSPFQMGNMFLIHGWFQSFFLLEFLIVRSEAITVACNILTTFLYRLPLSLLFVGMEDDEINESTARV